MISDLILFDTNWRMSRDTQTKDNGKQGLNKIYTPVYTHWKRTALPRVLYALERAKIRGLMETRVRSRSFDSSAWKSAWNMA